MNDFENPQKLNHKRVTFIVVGAGSRGFNYAAYAVENPALATVVGVAEPHQYRRERFLKAYGETIPKDFIFSDWKELLDKEKIADAALITTPDKLHVEPAIALAKKGYHLLVEKPLATTEEECIGIVKAVKENNLILSVGHVLRYTPYTQKIKQIVDSGILGDIVNIQHVEPVGNWHFAHSYVRGNWRREDQATFSLMAKSCHDIDWIHYIMNKVCTKVSSFGSLKHFKKENKPKEAESVSRCLDCPIQDTCPYSAKIVYLDSVKGGNTHWPVSVIVESDPSIESVTKALKEGPYGRCAYECDNDVCDNQVVNFQFSDSSTSTFTMIAYSYDICQRKTRIYGTHGELDCNGIEIRHVDFTGGKMATTTYVPKAEGLKTSLKGHFFGDWFLMRSFIAGVAEGNQKLVLSGPDETLESHLLVFQAEKARRTNSVVNILQH